MYTLKSLNAKYQNEIYFSAPTGRACANILPKCKTMHFVFDFSFSTNKELYARKISEVKEEFSSVRIIVFEEVSMIGPRYMGFSDHFLRRVYNVDIYFAGRSVLMTGYLNQLPPVNSVPLYSQIEEGEDFLSELVKRYLGSSRKIII